MKYIGNKTRILSFIESCLKESKIDFNNKKVADLFSGTGSVSNFFLRNNCTVYACDNMTYSICEQYRVNYYNTEPIFEELEYIVGDSNLSSVLLYLNNLKEKNGYFYNNFAPSGEYGRQYFSDTNAKKIDAISYALKEWKKILPFEKYMFLNGILMSSADKISNTSGTYGAYLKIWRSMALKKMLLEKPEFSSKGKCYITQEDVITFSKKHKNFDIVYLDPPYNKRQYASNFHVLESIVVNDKQKLKGKTGLRNYENQKSDFCVKSKVLSSFTKLINSINSKYIVMSYSSEGLLAEEQILNILCQKGNVKIYKNNYRRFKTNSWTSNKTKLQEIIFICEID